MQDPSNRFVVIISALITLLVLGGATLAVGFRNGWLHVATDAPSRDAVTALAQLTDAERSRTLRTAREANPSPALEAGAAVVGLPHVEDRRGGEPREERAAGRRDQAARGDGPRPRQFPDSVRHPLHVGVVKLLERKAGRCRDVGKADATHRRLQVIEPPLGGQASDLCAGASHRPAGEHGEITPDGKFVVVVNQGSNNLSVFSLDATTGALTPVPGSPFPSGPQPGPMASHVHEPTSRNRHTRV